MILTPCSREKEISDLLKAGHWPRACSPELHAHVRCCRQCRDLIAITQAFQQARAQSARDTRLQAPGVLWWRAQLRRRHAALERIARPITAAQIFALSLNVLAAVVFVLSQARHGLHWLSRLAALPQSETFHVKTLWTGVFIHSGWSSWPFILALGTLALCSAVLLYLATEHQ
ncbi:MAG: hypothetical protein WA419_00610 [Silvibacterium sp.]